MSNIVIWGTGTAYRRFIDKFAAAVDFLIDNDSKKWGMSTDGLIIYPPEKLKEYKDALVIVCSMYYDEISMQLHEYGFEDYQIINSLDCSEEQIIKYGFFNNKVVRNCLESSGINFIDVGCRGGIPPLWKNLQKYLRVVGFEPDEEGYKALMTDKPDNFLYLNAALSNKKSLIEFYVNSDLQTSSVFPIDETYFKRFSAISNIKNVDTVKIQADTLDNQLAQADMKDIDFIKLDTQGSELQILEGAIDTVSGSVLGIEAEVEFLPLYKGQPLFCDVDRFLRGKGFELFDLNSISWHRQNKLLNDLDLKYDIERSKSQLVYADALYFKSEAEIHRLFSGINDAEWKKSKALRFISICVLYDFLDYAIEIANIAREQNVLSTEEYKLIIEVL